MENANPCVLSQINMEEYANSVWHPYKKLLRRFKNEQLSW